MRFSFFNLIFSVNGIVLFINLFWYISSCCCLPNDSRHIRAIKPSLMRRQVNTLIILQYIWWPYFGIHVSFYYDILNYMLQEKLNWKMVHGLFLQFQPLNIRKLMRGVCKWQWATMLFEVFDIMFLNVVKTNNWETFTSCCWC